MSSAVSSFPFCRLLPTSLDHCMSVCVCFYACINVCVFVSFPIVPKVGRQDSKKKQRDGLLPSWPV